MGLAWVVLQGEQIGLHFSLSRRALETPEQTLSSIPRPPDCLTHAGS